LKIKESKVAQKGSVCEELKKAVDENGWGDIAAFDEFGQVTTFDEMLDDRVPNLQRSFEDLSKDDNGNVVISTMSKPAAFMAGLALGDMGKEAMFVSPWQLASKKRNYLKDLNAETLLIQDQFFPMAEDNIIGSNTQNIIPINILEGVGDESLLLKRIRAAQGIPKMVPDFAIKAEINKTYKSIFKNKVLKDRNIVTLDDFIGATKYANWEATKHYDPDSPTALLFSSGTTGEPKGIELTDSVVHNMREALSQLNMHRDPGDRFGTFVPILWPSIWNDTGVQALLAGMTVVTQPIMRPNGEREDIHELRFQHMLFSMTQAILTFLLQEFEENEFENFKTVAVGGEAIVPSKIVRINEVLQYAGVKYPKVIIAAGQSETGSAVFIGGDNVLGGDPKSAYYAGPPKPGDSARVVDDDGNILGPNEIGHLEAKTPTLAAGYLGRKEEFNNNITKDGYWKFGDVGSYDEHGNFDMLDRDKNIIERGDKKVYFQEIVRAMHEAEDEAIIQAVMTNGESGLKAHLRLNPQINIDEAKLMGSLNSAISEQFGAEFLPIGYKFHEQFPMQLEAPVKVDTHKMSQEADGVMNVMADGDLVMIIEKED